ncbi:MAG: PadR family transcriptional regulator [Nitriliruptoraceae bacterium]
MTPPLSYNAALVLQTIVNGDGYGFDIMRTTGLASGTVYPILRRLEAGGLVASRWEDPALAHEKGRPPRCYYRPTAEGRSELATARDRLTRQQAVFGLAGRPATDAGGSEP